MKSVRVTSFVRSDRIHAVGVERPSSLRTRPDESGHYERTGFTLIELLVVVTVLLILILMTVTAIDFTFTAERVRSASRQVQSALAGARDRAIFAKEPRGLRFLVDPDEPRLVTSMIYVGASRNWTEGQIRLERPDFNPTNNVADSPAVTIVRGDESCGWYTLFVRGFLGVFEDRNLNGVLDTGEDQNGNGLLDLDAPRIKIPADDNGSWYTVLTYRLTASNQILELVTPYRDPGTTPPTEVVAFQGTGPNTYILELPPRILPDAQPILLPETTCIDLDGSGIPPSWRPGPGAGLTVPYSGHMDVMFSPRGVVTGPLAAQGLVNLYVAERKDVEKTVNLGRPAINSNTPGVWVPGQNQFSPDDPIGHRFVVTVFTQTGKISAHHIDAADSDSNGYADNPFRYATEGEATSQ